MKGQLTRGAGSACVSGPRLRAGRVGDAGGVCGIYSAADEAQAAGSCAGLAAVLAAAVRRGASALATGKVTTATLCCPCAFQFAGRLSQLLCY